MVNVALIMLYFKHRDALRKYLRRRLHGAHWQALEDVEQELMTRLMRGKVDPVELRVPVSYLYMVARNTVFDHIEAHQKALAHGLVFEVEAIEEALDEESSVADVSDGLATLDEVDWLLRQLPDMQRLVLVLHHMEGYKISEIAETLGMPYGTVDKYVARAKKRSREILTERREAVERKWA